MDTLIPPVRLVKGKDCKFLVDRKGTQSRFDGAAIELCLFGVAEAVPFHHADWTHAQAVRRTSGRSRLRRKEPSERSTGHG